jgi:drug/metabolite transporter superfamily protein YnfA
MKRRIHVIAGLLALTLVGTFMIATIVVEIVGDRSAVVAVKTAILFALVALVPSVMIAGLTGRSMAAGRRAPLIRRKQRRTALVAVVGIAVLVPCAVVLRAMAVHDDFGTNFAAIQAVELAGGLLNLTLLSLNARDGRRLTAPSRRRSTATASTVPR